MLLLIGVNATAERGGGEAGLRRREGVHRPKDGETTEKETEPGPLRLLKMVKKKLTTEPRRRLTSIELFSCSFVLSFDFS